PDVRVPSCRSRTYGQQPLLLYIHSAATEIYTLSLHDALPIFGKVEAWRQINQSLRKSAAVPDPNEENFIYQMLLGAMAFEGEDEEEFLQRTLDYLQKVLREAKTHTNSSEHEEAYEQQDAGFVKDILKHQTFRQIFNAFKNRIADF